MEKKNKPVLLMLLSSDHFDKALAAFTIAVGAAATNFEVKIFFTFWGFNIIRKKKSRLFKGKFFLQKIFSLLNRGSTYRSSLSKLNMMGIGTMSVRSLMKKKGIASLEELMAMGKELGVKFYACEMTMGLFGLEKKDLLDDLVGDYIGVTSFVSEMQSADTTLYI